MRKKAVVERNNVFSICDSMTKGVAESGILKDYDLKIRPQPQCTRGDIEDQIKPDAINVHQELIASLKVNKQERKQRKWSSLLKK